MAYTFISGATGGIGREFCFLCAEKGDDLYLTGRSEEKLSALKKELSAVNPDIKISVFACDLTDKDKRAEMFSDIENGGIAFGRIINVAGADIQKPFAEYTREKVLFQIRVNAEAAVDVTHGLLPFIKGGGQIITVGSMSGVTPMPYFALYSATKSFLADFFTALRYELKDRKIKVTTVLPGGVPTRPDVVQSIKEQGLWGKLSAKPADFVAVKSLKAARKNKAIYVPGGFNKFLYFVMKITPKRVVMRFIARRWKNQRKDAF